MYICIYVYMYALLRINTFVYLYIDISSIPINYPNIFWFNPQVLSLFLHRPISIEPNSWWENPPFRAGENPPCHV